MRLRVMSSAAVVVAALAVAPAGGLAAPSRPVDLGSSALLGGSPAIVVDAQDGAWVASVAPDIDHIQVCRIPPGGSACTGTQQLAPVPVSVPATYPPLSNGQQPAGTVISSGLQVDSVRLFLDGTGNPLLAASVEDGLCGFTGLELFTSSGGQWNGPQLVGSVEPANPEALALEPDFSGFDVVGGMQTLGCSFPSVYDFAPLTAGASEQSQQLADPAHALLAVTKLPDGATAVLGGSTQTGATTLGRIQPAAGGPFGPWESLGVPTVLATGFSPSGGSYLAVGQPEGQNNPNLLLQYYDQLLLYAFHGERLGRAMPLGNTVNAAITLAGAENGLPALAVDPTGNVHAVWEDFCNPSNPPDSDICLRSREVLGGARLTSTTTLRDIGAGGGECVPCGLIAVSADAGGDGWALTWDRHRDVVAQPLFVAPAASLAGASLTLSGPPSPLLGGSARVSMTVSGLGARRITAVRYVLRTPRVAATGASIRRAATAGAAARRALGRTRGQQVLVRRRPFAATLRLPVRPGAPGCGLQYRETLTATAFAGRRHRKMTLGFTWCPQ